MEATRKKVIVRQVFADNLEVEFKLIGTVLVKYPIVAMDTEFPGTIFKQDKHSVQLGDCLINYQFMKANVDTLNIIQIGLTLSDAHGNLPDFGTHNCYIWEFNFRDFDIYHDPQDYNSIALLKRQGINFRKNRRKGIDSRDFAAKVRSSSLVFNNRLSWMTFHGAYDFGFLVKVLTQRELPYDLSSFMAQVYYFFGFNVFDLKHTFRILGMHGGLEKVAQLLKVARVAGESHQAGSDSLLTLQCGMKLKMRGIFEPHNVTKLLPSLALYGLVSNLDHLPMIYQGIKQVLHHRYKKVDNYETQEEDEAEDGDGFQTKGIQIQPFWNHPSSGVVWAMRPQLEYAHPPPYGYCWKNGALVLVLG